MHVMVLSKVVRVFVWTCMFLSVGLNLYQGTAAFSIDPEHEEDDEDRSNVDSLLASSKTNKYYMNAHCGKTIKMPDRNAVRLIPWEGNHPRSYVNCTVLLEVFYYQNYQLLVTFHEMDLTKQTATGHCKKARLELYNGDSTRNRSLTDINGICGGEKDRTYTTTQYQLLTVFQTGQLHPNQYEYFEAIITPYHTGRRCDGSEYKCDNGRCISEDLVCDGYNNCGDESDERKCSVVALSIAAIIAIVAGALIFLAIIIAIIICRCCCSVCGYERI